VAEQLTGNLKYTTTKEEIAKHFAECGTFVELYNRYSFLLLRMHIDPPPSIRLLTPKAKPGAPVNKAIKSKGCAFLEFSQKNSLQQGLRLHHSVLDGRQINVELTAGGGGNSTTRLTKLKERNKELHGQRVRLTLLLAERSLTCSQTKAAEKRKTSPKQPEDKAEEIAQLIAGKRFSATSGVEEAPKVQRTWTVGDVQEETTHRGGVKHKKSDRQRGAKKSQASGMNAIPVG
jgi:nucleolar protein 6